MNSRVRIVSLAALCVTGILTVWSCGGRTEEPQPAKAAAPAAVSPAAGPALVTLHPDNTITGKAFNVQKNGAAGLAVTTRDAKNTSTIFFAGQRLDTVYGGPELLTTEVPAALYAKPGHYDVWIQTGDQKSNTLVFEVH